MIPTYNRAWVLPRAIESILQQDFQDWEMLIVNDASTDDTRDVIARYEAQDKRIRGIHHTQNRRNAGALNTALEHVQGAYIAKLDDDDAVAPNWIRDCAKALDEEPKAYAVMVAQGIRDLNTSPPNNASNPLHGDMPRFLRASAVRALGGWSSFLATGEDKDLHFRALASGWQAAQINEPLYFYNLTTDAHNLSHSPNLLTSELLLHNTRRLYERALPSLEEQGFSLRQSLRIIFGKMAVWPERLKHYHMRLGRARHTMTLADEARDAQVVLVFWQWCRLAMRVPARLQGRWQALVLNVWHNARTASLSVWRSAWLCLSFLPVLIRDWYMIRLRPKPHYLNTAKALPAITVVLPVAHERQYVREAIKQIREQTFVDWELLVVNCGAPRRALRAVRRLAMDDARISLVNRRPVRMARVLDVASNFAHTDILCYHQIGTKPKPHFLELGFKYFARYRHKQILGIRGTVEGKDIYLPRMMRLRFPKATKKTDTVRRYTIPNFWRQFDGVTHATTLIAEMDLSFRARAIDSYMPVSQRLCDYSAGQHGLRKADITHARQVGKQIRRAGWFFQRHNMQQMYQNGTAMPLLLSKYRRYQKLLPSIPVASLKQYGARNDWNIRALFWRARKHELDIPATWQRYGKLLWRRWQALGLSHWQRLTLLWGIGHGFLMAWAIGRER